MLTKTSFHRWSDPQSLMNTPKVMVHVKQRDHRNVIVQLLAERIRKARKPAHLHSHVEILALDVAGRNVLLFRVAYDFHALGAQTLCGAVSGLSLGIVAVNLVKLGEVDAITESIRNGSQVHPVAVRGQLDSIRQTSCNVLKEIRRTPRVPPAYGPANYKLRIRINRSEGPNVANIAHALPHLCRGVLLFGIAEAPNLVDLNTLRFNVANGRVLILLASFPDLHQGTQHRALRRTRHASRRANRAAFYQRCDDRRLLCDAEYVCHGSTIRQRFSIVNRKVTTGADLLLFFGLRPTCFRGLPSASRALFVRHRLKPTLAANLAALRAHLAHDLLNDSKFRGFRGLHENAASILNRIKFWSTACPLWHTPKRCTNREHRQEMPISNRPTTRISMAKRTRTPRLEFDHTNRSSRLRFVSGWFLIRGGNLALDEPYWKVVEPILEEVDIYRGVEAFTKSFTAVRREVGLLCAAFWCQSEVRNGGLGQFFGNNAHLVRAPSPYCGYGFHD
jgi:hypothetical protein